LNHKLDWVYPETSAKLSDRKRTFVVQSIGSRAEASRSWIQTWSVATVSPTYKFVHVANAYTSDVSRKTAVHHKQ
jgi:hypothetical protein